MGEDWVKDFLLPILDEMWGEIQKTQFTKYPQTSEKFKKLIKEAFNKIHLLVDKNFKPNYHTINSHNSMDSISILQGVEKLEQEPFNMNIFVLEYNKLADKYSGWYYEEDMSTYSLESDYKANPKLYPTNSQFASIVFDMQQRM